MQLRPHYLRIVATILSGLLFYSVLGLNPFWLAAWLAPIPLLLAAFHAGRLEARLLTWLALAIGLSSEFAYYWKVTGPVATLITIILIMLLWGFIIGRTRAVLLSSTHWLTIFVYPVILAAAETLVAFFSPHGTAGSLAFGQMGFLPVVQIAAILGAPAIVFLISLFASTVAVALYRGREISHPWLGYGLAVAILLSILGWGALRLRIAAKEPSITVGLVAIDEVVRPGLTPDQIWGAYAQAVRGLAAEGARIIVLPEKIFSLAPAEASERRTQFAALARDAGAYLVVGLQLNQPGRKRNVSWLFNPSRDLLAEYDKQHMVPYLESDLSPGRKNIVCKIDGKPYGLVICRDMFFKDLGRAYSRLGVAALLIPAWDFYVDAWWASRVAALRGVEGGYSVVRASRESLLAMSDRYGRILAEKRSAKLPGATLLATLPLGPAAPTPYARFGDVFGWLCVAGALVAIFFPRRAPAPGLKAGAATPSAARS